MSPNPFPAFVTAEFVTDHLSDPQVVIVDCRWKLSDSQYGQAAYDRSHISGAFFMDLSHDLSGPRQVFGGRHPLPTSQQFEESVAPCGISDDVHVICYDDDGAGAARCWWLLRFYGHHKVSVLQGGYPLWIKEQRLVTSDLPEERSGDFVARPQLNLLVDFQGVYTTLHRYPLIDARDPRRYRGDEEPVDRIPGHIPGARNIPYGDLLEAPALYHRPDTLQSVFDRTITASETPVIYCGSGVSACVNVLALFSIGRDAILYAGSWSDWIEHDRAPIA